MLSVWTRLPKRIDQDWFAREQPDLTHFANDPWARQYLGLDVRAPEFSHLPVVGLWGNAVHYQVGRKERVAVFYSGDHFAKRLHGFTQMVRRGGEFNARVRLETPAKEALAWAMATTTVFNPDADPETTSVDGRLSRQVVSETFATIRNGAGNAVQAGASITIFTALIATGTTNEYSDFSRAALLFDSSSLTSGAAISAATLSPWVTGKNDAFGSQSIGVVTSTPATNTALVAADFTQFGTTRQASDIALSAIATGAYKDFALNATGIGNVSKTGVSKFGLRFSGDIDNVSPGWTSGARAGELQGHYADDANKPKLTVTYSLGGGSAMFLMF